MWRNDDEDEKKSRMGWECGGLMTVVISERERRLRYGVVCRRYVEQGHTGAGIHIDHVITNQGRGYPDLDRLGLRQVEQRWDGQAFSGWRFRAGFSRWGS